MARQELSFAAHLRHVVERHWALAGARIAAHLSQTGSTTGAHWAREAMGLVFPAPLGLAAGLDKTGGALAALTALGFGFIEAGTATVDPGEGYRHIDRLAANLARARRLHAGSSRRPVLGASIGVHPATSLEAAAVAFREGLGRLAPHADYVTINLAGYPPDDRLPRLLTQIAMARAQPARTQGFRLPLVLKLPRAASDELVRAARDIGVDGVILSTPADRSDAARALDRVRATAGPDLEVIAVGGVHDASDLDARLNAGASLVQVYSAFIRRGAHTARDLLSIGHRNSFSRCGAPP